MSFVYVKVNARAEFKYVPRARRFWPVGETLKVEIQEKEPDDVVVKTTEGLEVSAPPLLVLGPTSYKALMDDPQNRFTILSDMESQAAISQESVHAARQEVQKLGGRVVDLEAENAELKKDLAEAEDTIDRLQDEIAKLKAVPAAAPAPVAATSAPAAAPAPVAPAPAAPEAPSVPAKGGKAAAK